MSSWVDSWAVSAALSAALVIIGDRLGLYRAMRDGRPVSAEQLAKRTETPFKLVLEARP